MVLYNIINCKAVLCTSYVLAFVWFIVTSFGFGRGGHVDILPWQAVAKICNGSFITACHRELNQTTSTKIQMTWK